MFLLNGTKLASTFEDKAIKIQDAATSVSLEILSGNISAINIIASTKDDIVFGSVLADIRIKIWDI